MQRNQIHGLHWGIGTLVVCTLSTVGIGNAGYFMTGVCQTLERATTGTTGWALQVIFRTAFVAFHQMPW